MVKSWNENDNQLSKRAFLKTAGLAFDTMTFEWLYAGLTLINLLSLESEILWTEAGNSEK